MKILQLSTKVPYPPKDGGAAGVYAFSEAFVSLGHQVDIIAVNPPKHFVPPSKLQGSLPQGLRILTVNINTSPSLRKALANLFFTSIPYQVERFINKDFETRLVETLEQTNPDIIQIEGIYLCPYIPTLRKHTNRKIVIRAHNIEHILWQSIAEKEPNLAKRVYLKIQAKRIKDFEMKQFLLADAVITFTSNDLSQVHLLAPRVKAKVVPYGTIVKLGNTLRPFTPHAISFIGALDWMPNQEAIKWLVSNVWPTVRSKFPELQFHIAGRNAPPNLASFLASQKGIVFHGEVANSSQFLNQFSIALVPLFSGSGIRVKIIEAMQHGLAVIASAKAADGINAIPGEHYLQANSTDEFVAGITQLLSSETLCTQLSQNAFAFVCKNFNIFDIASELIEFYNDINNNG